MISLNSDIAEVRVLKKISLVDVMRSQRRVLRHANRPESPTSRRMTVYRPALREKSDHPLPTLLQILLGSSPEVVVVIDRGSVR